MSPKIKSILPHLVAVAAFLILSSVYFSPLFDGYSLKQSDIRQFQGMSKEIVDNEKRIEDTKSKQSSKQSEIKKQEEVLEALRKKMKSIH